MFQSFFQTFFQDSWAAYTHLYSVKSLEFICNKYKFKPLANWWFGQDGIDLKRSVINQSIFLNSSKYYNNYLFNCINTIEEKFQNLIDESKYCSEVHMVLKKGKMNKLRFFNI